MDTKTRLDHYTKDGRLLTPKQLRRLDSKKLHKFRRFTEKLRRESEGA